MDGEAPWIALDMTREAYDDWIGPSPADGTCRHAWEPCRWVVDFGSGLPPPYWANCRGRIRVNGRCWAAIARI